jgi:hypothetical protein
MSKAWFRSHAGSSYSPASREGWAVLVGYTFGVTLIGVGLPLLADGALWSWLLAPLLVIAATIWLFHVVRTHSARPE